MRPAGRQDFHLDDPPPVPPSVGSEGHAPARYSWLHASLPGRSVYNPVAADAAAAADGGGDGSSSGDEDGCHLSAIK